jgi:hypothetical protein
MSPPPRPVNNFAPSPRRDRGTGLREPESRDKLWRGIGGVERPAKAFRFGVTGHAA